MPHPYALLRTDGDEYPVASQPEGDHHDSRHPTATAAILPQDSQKSLHLRRRVDPHRSRLLPPQRHVNPAQRNVILRMPVLPAVGVSTEFKST